MNYTTEKEIFTHQLKKFANTLAMHIAKDDEWTVEPFMGSGVVGFNIAPENAIFSDTNPHIINFYTQIQNGIITPQKVRDFLEYEGEKLAASDAEYYIYVRNRFNAEHDPLDFLFLNRSCFNGMMRFNKNNDFNVPYGHKPERFAKAYITKIVNQVAFVQTKIKLNNWFLCVNHSMKLSVCGRTCICGCGERMQSFDTGGRRYARLCGQAA